MRSAEKVTYRSENSAAPVRRKSLQPKTNNPCSDFFLTNTFVTGKTSNRSLKIELMLRARPEILSQSANRFQFVLDDCKFFALISGSWILEPVIRKSIANLTRLLPPCGRFLPRLDFTSHIVTATYDKPKECSDLGNRLTSFFSSFGGLQKKPHFQHYIPNSEFPSSNQMSIQNIFQTLVPILYSQPSLL